MEKHPFIRTVYLYLFTLVGLALVVIGSVGMVNLGLRSFVFTKADEDEKLNYVQPFSSPIAMDRLVSLGEGKEVYLTESELTSLRSWLVDYEAWKELSANRDYVGARRSREISTNISLIVIGIPLYLYHWGIIKKDRKEKNERE
jgi:hypothetical protein